MRINDQNWNIIDVIRGFFPLQLIIYHLKYNLISLFFWALLFLIVLQYSGYSFGIPFLFLSPEYLGSVSPFSFLLVGFALGGFTVAFNTYSYMKLGSFFPFLTTLSKPFFLFSVNNSIIPLGFFITYLIQVGKFQAAQELATSGEIALYIIATLIGTLIFFLFSWTYFFPLSKRTTSYQPQSDKPISSVIHKKEKWYNRFKKNSNKIFIFFGRRFRLTTSRSTSHFDRDIVEKIFAKNRINASIFEILTISVFFILGLLNNYKYLEVPAAASIVLLITISLMLFSALHSWLRNWVYVLLIIGFVSMDYISQKTDFFHYRSYAYGLDYSKRENYTLEELKSICNNDSLYTNSLDNYISILEKWKSKTQQEKPKLIIVTTSGGGSRSALWTTHVLNELNQKFDGQIFNQTQMITGASGGMVGAAFYRELILRSNSHNINKDSSEVYHQMMAEDLLNKLAFMASTNDIFLRYQKYDYNDHSYTKDRGYAFESQLNENTNYWMDHTLGYYEEPEKDAEIPVMILSPTIVNDGRRLLLSSQSMAFMANEAPDSKTGNSYENIDAHSYFRKQNINELKFTTALRSSASFPFVMPMIAMPTTPEIQLMDAGIRDNYGIKTAMLYLHKLQDWIKKNTSGVIILQIRDTKKTQQDENKEEISFFNKLTLPFGNMYKNFPGVQDFNQEELVNLAKYEFDVDFVSFNLIEKQADRVSLSWHLTEQEVNKVLRAMQSPDNKASQEKLKTILQKK